MIAAHNGKNGKEYDLRQLDQKLKLTISEFCALYNVSPGTARELSRSREFIENGISIKINPVGTKGGIRIDHDQYKKWLKTNPVVPDCKRVKPKKSFK